MSAVRAAEPVAERSRFSEFAGAREDEFLAKGYARRDFFPHRVRHLPKCGPDGFRLGARMCGSEVLDRQWQVLLYAAPDLLAEFPRDLFFDRDVMWHEQHLGLPGQVASANVVLEEGRAWSYVHQSDLVQRIGRRRECKTRVDSRFGSWPKLLVNALLDFALRHGARELRVATAALAMAHTDPARDVGPELFERTYDRSLRGLAGVREQDGWWLVDVEANRDRVVAAEPREDPLAMPGRVVCVCHDIERGLGHRDVDPGFAARADAESPGALETMLAAERAAGVRATYNVVGVMLDELRGRIEGEGHAIGFHSHDHGDGPEQLEGCRAVDYRIKGYRVPRSEIGPDLADERLAHHNFEWLASWDRSLGLTEPRLVNRIVRVPVHLDDFAMHGRGMAYADWERIALERVDSQAVTVLSLHDCYGGHWLPGYGALLERLRERAELWTVDELAAHVTLAAAG